MTVFDVPSKHGNEVCGDCHDTQEKVYHECTEPCGRLLTFAAMNAGKVVSKASTESVHAIKERRDLLRPHSATQAEIDEYYRQKNLKAMGVGRLPPFESVGGD